MVTSVGRGRACRPAAGPLAVVLVAGLLLASCGGGDDAAGEASVTPAATPTVTAIAQNLSPEALGDAIGAHYVNAMRDLVALLEPRPPAAGLENAVSTIKERYIAQLVELGQQKEAFSASDRSVVDTRVRSAIDRVPSDTFAAFSDALDFYQEAGAQEVADLIRSFNIITQYADFDLLKRQEPGEAARLGID